MRKTLTEKELSDILTYLRTPNRTRNNIEEKVKTAQTTLENLPEGHDKASVNFALGKLYLDLMRIGSEKASDLAIECYERVKPYRPKGSQAWARLNSNLSVAWRNRTAGEKSENIERAIECLNEAAGAYFGISKDDTWANIQGNLSNNYFDRIKGDTQENIEKSIFYQKQCLQYFVSRNVTERIIRCNTNLGKLYEGRIKKSHQDNLRQAIQFYYEAISIYDDRPIDYEWARTKNNLGVSLYSLTGDDRVDRIKEAIGHLKDAELVWSEAEFPVDWASIQLNLCNAYRNLGKEECVAGHFQTAIDHSASTSHILTLDLDTKLLIACGKMRAQYCLEDWHDVIETASQAQLLCINHVDQSRDMFSRRRLALRYHTATSIAIQAHYKQGNSDQALKLFQSSRNSLMRSDQQPPALKELDDQRVRVSISLFSREERPALSFVEIANSKELIVVELEKLTPASVNSLMRGDQNSWLPSYDLLIKEQNIKKIQEAIQVVRCSLEDLLAPLLATLSNLDQKYDSLDIIPNGSLAMFPFAMLRLNTGELVGERYSISYPVTGGYHANTEIGSDIKSGLLISNPTGDLPHSKAETEFVHSKLTKLKSKHLSGAEASKHNVIQELRMSSDYDLIHLSCHGRHGWRQPEQSALLLHQGEELTYEEMSAALSIKPGCLVVLSACESGMGEYEQLPDDFYGLPSLFLNSGAGDVICSLWPVSDASTRNLMQNFYTALLEDKASVSRSLQFSQNELRENRVKHMASSSPRKTRWGNHSNIKDSTQFNAVGPYYWAGFIHLTR